MTEYMNGGDLRTVLSSEVASSLTWADFKCAIAISIAEALEDLQSLHPKVILSDLHSRHVLLDDEFFAKVNSITISRKRTIDRASSGKLEATYWLSWHKSVWRTTRCCGRLRRVSSTDCATSSRTSCEVSSLPMTASVLCTLVSMS